MDKYLKEVLLCNEDDFLRSVYKYLLGREPDPDGLLHYTLKIQSGYSRINIIKQISSGFEFKNFGLHKDIVNNFIESHKFELIFNNLKILNYNLSNNKVFLACRKNYSNFKEKDYLTSMLNIVSRSQSIKNIFEYEEIDEFYISRVEFDTAWYLNEYEDVAIAGIDPYEHYINFGKAEGRLGIKIGSIAFPQLVELSPVELEALKNKIIKWPRHPLISIVMPVFNTKKEWLRDAIESVLSQIYENWELCIVDDSSTSVHVQEILDYYCSKDTRIKSYRLKKNLGVACASNYAITKVSGEYTALFDHDDLLEKNALFHVAESIIHDYPDMIYSDEIIVNEDSSRILNHAFRPMFSLELLRSHCYIVHLVVFRTKILKAVGGFDENLKISHDYDLILRIAENAHNIVHIPIALYRWRTHNESVGNVMKSDVTTVSKEILTNHLRRCGVDGYVNASKYFNFFETRYTLNHRNKVAIIIPTKNHATLLKQCIDSINKTVKNIDYDIVVIDHDSDEESMSIYLNSIAEDIIVIKYSGEFNFSKINNFAVENLMHKYSHYLFCNNDIEALSDDWLHRMLELGQQKDVGAVGAKLLYDTNRKIQHAGVCVGMYGAAEHYGKFQHDNAFDLGEFEANAGYIGSFVVNREISAVTAACILVSSTVFESAGGFDPYAKVGFGDVDLCLRIGEFGFRVIFCPHAELIHHESISRGKSTIDPHPEDSLYFINRWQKLIDSGDPFYNPNLSLRKKNWSLKSNVEMNATQFPERLRRIYRKKFFHE